MDKLIVKGFINIEEMKFHDIEGGFGKDKKAILAKEIAIIHNREPKEINRRINDNIKRFKKDIDIIDLKGSEFEVNLKHHEIYNQNSINRSDNIYLLSERGYAKLLKILEDDVAWEQYEKLVDGYFNMRANSNVNKQLSPMDQLKLQYQVLEEHEQKIDNAIERIGKIENNTTIDYSQQEELRTLGTKKVIAILGGADAPAYKELNKKVFSSFWRDYKRKLRVNSYKNTLVKDFEIGRQAIISWQPSKDISFMISGCNAQMRM